MIMKLFTTLGIVLVLLNFYLLYRVWSSAIEEVTIQDRIQYLKEFPQTSEIKLEIQKLQQKL
tara:strand:- start:197 stop:382 length:186 start_codon:yes stop_codon:yes gene_type:complete